MKKSFIIQRFGVVKNVSICKCSHICVEFNDQLARVLDILQNTTLVAVGNYEDTITPQRVGICFLKARQHI